MPTYDYLCDSCGHQFEAFHAVTAEPVSKCPLCGSNVRKLIGAGSGLIFKGSGFYVTDYKSGNRNGSSAKKEKTTSTHKD